LSGRLLSFVYLRVLCGQCHKSITAKDTKLHEGYATFAILMAPNPQTEPDPEPLYCPKCSREVTDPLTCGDCSAVICRRCGTPLESPDELGMG
jgi:hypothetical protein